jgi:hypothetical protein
MFPYLSLTSIENDRETFERQQFHLCSRNMKAFHGEFKDYLMSDFPDNRPVIVWADYTKMNRECLLQAADIARRVPSWSIFRITVPAESPLRKFKLRSNPRTLPMRIYDEMLRKHRDGMAVDEICYDDKWFTSGSFSEKGYPVLLKKMIYAVVAGSCSHPKTFVPLHSAKYSDGTIMLSLTGIFCERDDRERVLEHFRTYYEFFGDADSQIDEIDVPFLTTKERLSLEGILPNPRCDGQMCVQKLGYLIEGNASDAESVRKMGHYEKYYRLYPYFGKLVP